MEQEERREAWRRELAAILQYESLKAEAVILRKKLDAEWNAVLGGPTEAPEERRAPQVEVQAERPSTVPLVTARSSLASIQSTALTFCTAHSRAESPTHSSTRSPSPNNPPSSDRSWEGWNRGTEEERTPSEASSTAPSAAGVASGAPVQSPRPTPRGGKGVPPGPRPPPKSMAASPTAGSAFPEMPGGSPRPGGKGPPPPTKGKGKGPPPPKAKAKASSAAHEDTPGRSSSSRLVNLHWRMSLEPQENEVSAAEDIYLSSIVEVLPRQRQLRYRDNLVDFDRAVYTEDFGIMDDGETPRASTPLAAVAANGCGFGCDTPRGDETPVGATAGAMTPVAGTPMTPARGSYRRRARRNTIFSEDCTVKTMTQGKLEEYFQARSAVIDMGPRASTGSVQNLINDAKHLQIIDILVRKEAILRQCSMEASVEALILALRNCNYDVAPPQVLEDIRKVTMAHMEDRSKPNVLTFVEARGKEALQDLDHPHLHRLLYGALRIPAFNARLNCMIMEATCDDNLRHCQENLEILRCGAECLTGLLDPLRHFFQVAKLLGNTLNQDSSIAVARYGFRLSSLQKFYEMKLPTRKDISLLHFMALMMPPDQMDALCNADALEILSKARSARSYTVHQVCSQLLDGFRKIRSLVQTGKYRDSEGKDVQIPVDDLDSEGGSRDAFYERMRAFVEKHAAKVDFIQAFCTDVFEAYWAIGAFFNDTKYVYPPPADDQQQHGDRPEKKDLFEVFHHLLAQLSCVRKEVFDYRLVQEIERTFSIKVPINAGNSVSSKKCEAAPHATNVHERNQVPSGGSTEDRVGQAAPTSAGDHAADATSSRTSSDLDRREACPAHWSPRDATPSALSAPSPSSSHSVQTPGPALAEATEGSKEPSSPLRGAAPYRMQDRDSERKPPEVSGSPLPPPPKRKVHDVRRSRSSPNCSPQPLRRMDSQDASELASSAAAVATASAIAAPPPPAVPMPPPKRNPGLKLPGVQRAGSQLSSSSSSTTLSGGGSSPKTPSKSPALSQCRKSLTNVALKAQKDGITRMLGETSEAGGGMQDALQDALRGLAWGTDSATCSPEPSPREDFDLNPHGVALTLNQQIRDTARRRKSRGQASQPSPTLPSMISPLPSPLHSGPMTVTGEFHFRCESPPRGRMPPDSPDSRKRPLTPVYEHTREASNSLTPARNREGNDELRALEL